MAVDIMYEPGVPCWIDTPQQNPKAAARFYQALFGWEFHNDGNSNEHYPAFYKGKIVAGINKASTVTPSGWRTYIQTADINDTISRIKDAGGSVTGPVLDNLPAGRSIIAADPAGAVFCLWEPGTLYGAQLINEPTSWTMSTLLGNGHALVQPFYKHVFGWETQAFGDSMTLWRLPGYDSGPIDQPVPHDVVAVSANLGEFPGSNASEHPHWAVTFWVADVSEIVDKAAQLGGTVLVPSFEASNFIQAVLSDPSGARFTIAQKKG